MAFCSYVLLAWRARAPFSSSYLCPPSLFVLISLLHQWASRYTAPRSVHPPSQPAYLRRPSKVVSPRAYSFLVFFLPSRRRSGTRFFPSAAGASFLCRPRRRLFLAPFPAQGASASAPGGYSCRAATSPRGSAALISDPSHARASLGRRGSRARATLPTSAVRRSLPPTGQRETLSLPTGLRLRQRSRPRRCMGSCRVSKCGKRGRCSRPGALEEEASVSAGRSAAGPLKAFRLVCRNNNR